MSTSPWSGDSPDGRRVGRDEASPHRGRDGAAAGGRQRRVGMVGVPGVAVERDRDRRGARVGRLPHRRVPGVRAAPRRSSPTTHAAVSQYAQAIAAENVDLQTFLRETIVRPGFRPIIDQWKPQIDAGEVPTNLLENEEYLDELFADSEAADAKALAASVRSEEAGNTADDYIRLTLFFATALVLRRHHGVVQDPLPPAPAAHRWPASPWSSPARSSPAIPSPEPTPPTPRKMRRACALGAHFGAHFGGFRGWERGLGTLGGRRGARGGAGWSP